LGERGPYAIFAAHKPSNAAAATNVPLAGQTVNRYE